MRHRDALMSGVPSEPVWSLLTSQPRSGLVTVESSGTTVGLRTNQGRSRADQGGLSGDTSHWACTHFERPRPAERGEAGLGGLASTASPQAGFKSRRVQAEIGRSAMTRRRRRDHA